MKRHISILGEEIPQYFSDLKGFQNYCRFVNNFFGTRVEDLPSRESFFQEQCMDLVNSGKARNLIIVQPSCDFWIEMAQTYPGESAFSAPFAIKPKARNRLCAIRDMRVALSKTKQNIAELIARAGHLLLEK